MEIIECKFYIRLLDLTSTIINTFFYFDLALPTGTGSPQQHMPINVGPFTPPCQLSLWEYPEITHGFRQSVDIIIVACSCTEVERVSEPGNLVPRNVFELRVSQKIFQRIFQHFEITLFTQLTTILLFYTVHTNISAF
jgi:hypothetical protein